mmetsp:Transcript_4877/g.20878  ORF Transcript_4877/g.20878 Transcript_4877/m.20878 type:complete len:866 (+) Transcript_4877:889-3486(+)
MTERRDAAAEGAVRGLSCPWASASGANGSAGALRNCSDGEAGRAAAAAPAAPVDAAAAAAAGAAEGRGWPDGGCCPSGAAAPPASARPAGTGNRANMARYTVSKPSTWIPLVSSLSLTAASAGKGTVPGTTRNSGNMTTTLGGGNGPPALAIATSHARGSEAATQSVQGLPSAEEDGQGAAGGSTGCSGYVVGGAGSPARDPNELPRAAVAGSASGPPVSLTLAVRAPGCGSRAAAPSDAASARCAAAAPPAPPAAAAAEAEDDEDELAPSPAGGWNTEEALPTTSMVPTSADAAAAPSDPGDSAGEAGGRLLSRRGGASSTSSPLRLNAAPALATLPRPAFAPAEWPASAAAGDDGWDAAGDSLGDPPVSLADGVSATSATRARPAAGGASAAPSRMAAPAPSRIRGNLPGRPLARRRTREGAPGALTSISLRSSGAEERKDPFSAETSPKTSATMRSSGPVSPRDAPHPQAVTTVAASTKAMLPRGIDPGGVERTEPATTLIAAACSEPASIEKTPRPESDGTRAGSGTSVGRKGGARPSEAAEAGWARARASAWTACSAAAVAAAASAADRLPSEEAGGLLSPPGPSLAEPASPDASLRSAAAEDEDEDEDEEDDCSSCSGASRPVCPASFAPQARTLPSWSKNIVKPRPQAACRTGNPSSASTRVGASTAARGCRVPGMLLREGAPASAAPRGAASAPSARAVVPGRGSPSWPREPFPAMNTRPVRDTKAVWSSPQATCWMSSGRAVTRRGTCEACGTWARSRPSRPCLLRPHEYARPVTVTATTCTEPAAICVHGVPVSAATRSACHRPAVSPRPRQPCAPDPTVYTSPAAPKTTVKFSPHATCTARTRSTPLMRRGGRR